MSRILFFSVNPLHSAIACGAKEGESEELVKNELGNHRSHFSCRVYLGNKLTNKKTEVKYEKL